VNVVALLSILPIVRYRLRRLTARARPDRAGAPPIPDGVPAPADAPAG
jgi:hypothetical protein